MELVAFLFLDLLSFFEYNQTEINYIPLWGEVVMIYRIKENFIESDINPFTNMPYDSSWIIYQLTDSIDYQMMNGGKNNGMYTLKVSKKYPQWKMSVFDFLQFQETCNKNIILAISDEDFEAAKLYYGSHNYNDNFLRSYESDVLIHSTTLENWNKIKADGCLKSWNVLKKDNATSETQPIGKLLGDPDDFSDYIMFSNGGISGEIVVLSKQLGTIMMNQDMEYQTGARLYFDMKKIAEDGLLVRDGCHLKVKDKLPLFPYLIWTATWQSVGLANVLSTPKKFTELSNIIFNKLFNKNVVTTF